MGSVSSDAGWPRVAGTIASIEENRERTMPKRLTNRQAAVLAAVERLGRTNVLDLSADFPHVESSSIVRVLDRVHELGHLERAGDPGLVYVGGVEYWARPRDTPVTTALADAVLALLRRELGDDWAWLHPGGHDVVVAVRLTDIAQALGGDDAPLQRVARLVAQLRRDGKVDGVTVGAEIGNPQGQPSIVAHLRLPVGA